MTRMLRGELLFAALLLLISGGCSGSDGPARGAVEGTVNFNGEPVTEGTISFTPTDGTEGPMAGGTLDGSGQFKIEATNGPVVGKQRLSIIGLRKTGKKFDAFPPHKIMWDERQPYIPEQYNTKSELVVEVKSGTNKYEFDLKGKQ